jgi:hypothetical protein
VPKNNSILRRGFKAEAERNAERLRKELGKTVFDPLDAFELAEHLGIPVACFFEIAPELADALVRKNNGKVSAFIMPNVDGDPIILHNGRESAFRQQSNIMHELAHFLCGHKIPTDLKNIPVPGNIRYHNAEQEEEAKYLGGCLQVTKAGLLWMAKERRSVEEISDYYRASPDMVVYRVNVLGLRNKIRTY